MAKRFEKQQIEALKLAFEESDHLTKEKKIELVKVTGLDMEQISSWFNRKRTRKRSKESIGVLERTNAELQQALNGCQERETELQTALQESRDKIGELESENRHLRQCLITLEGDLLFYSGIRFRDGYPKSS